MKTLNSFLILLITLNQVFGQNWKKFNPDIWY